MTTEKIDEFITILKETCKDRGISEVSDYTYKQEIKEAIAEINRCRRFTPTEKVLYDPKYEDLIIPLCISSLPKIGAEGQLSHSENGVVRGYGTDGKYPASILKSIKPLIK